MSNIDCILNHIIKILLVIITCIMLIIGFIFFSPVYVHAESSNLIASYQIPYSPDSLQTGSNSYVTTTDTDARIFCVGYQSGNQKYIYFFQRTLDFNSGNPRKATITFNNHNSYTIYNSYDSYDSLWTYSRFYGSYDQLSWTNGYNIPLFTSLADIVNMLNQLDFDGSSSDVVDVGSKEFDIPAGYAFYILTNGGTATLTTKFTVYNNIFTGGWSGANQRIGISETRVPSSGYTFGSNTGSIIPWSKLSTADSNILGQTYYGQYIYTNCPDDGKYLVIYNPVYAYDDDVTSNENGTIHVEISNFCGANRFALRSSLGINGSVDSVSPDDYTNFQSTGGGEYISGNDSSLVWYDASRTSEEIDTSTGTTSPAPSSPYNDTSSVPDNNTFLGNLVERIVSFLEAPISHIKSLQDAAANFMGWLANLWQWLPETVVVVIVDALIVLIVIGVIKFLWK